jgi:hypothetical protein
MNTSHAIPLVEGSQNDNGLALMRCERRTWKQHIDSRDGKEAMGFLLYHDASAERSFRYRKIYRQAHTNFNCGAGSFHSVRETTDRRETFLLARLATL